MAVNQIIKNYTRKQIFKKEGIIGSAKAVDFSSNALEKKLQAFGIDTKLIQSESDLKQAIAFVDQLESKALQKQGEKLFKKESAEIFDLDKNKLDPKKPIMGGTQSEEDILQKSIKKNIDEATKKGDFTGIANQVLRDPEIAEAFARSKKFPFSKETNVRSGADAIPIVRKAEFDEEMGIKSMAKDRDYSVEKLVSDFKKFGNATDKDIQTILGSGKAGQIPYVMDNYGMSFTEVLDTLKKGKPLIEGLAKGGRAGFKEGEGIMMAGSLGDEKDDISREIFGKPVKDLNPDELQELMEELERLREKFRAAKGGRAGFKVGSPSKRLFLKTAGGIAALITAIKSGLIGVPKKEVAKQVIKESAKDVGSAPPEYFFNLANKIKNLGKESKVKPQERVNEYNYKGKDGSEYTLTEDIGTGEMQIVKEKAGVGIADDKTFDTIQDRTVMEYKPPRKDVDPDAEKILEEGPQYDEYKVEFDMDGTPADADDISEIIKKEIIEEASEIPEKKIKRASGGVAYMLGE